MCCAVVSLVISNLSFGYDYVSFWHSRLDLSVAGLSMDYDLMHWINDGLMALFFLLVGLEIERELYKGELTGVRNALLPTIAAFGGMLVPGLIHFSLNVGTQTQSGFGVPVATDIAFALGILSLAGGRIPVTLKILLAALAIMDDLGAVLVIALFYAPGFSVLYFTAAMVVFVGMISLNRLKVNILFPYLSGGLLMWFFMLRSGVHPTIAGVLLAFAIPFREGERASPSYKMQHLLCKPVAFVILPIFALANTAMIFEPGWYGSFIDCNTAGIMLGLVIGKPLGIFLFTLIAVKTGLGKLSAELSWRHVFGMGIIAGIGFTMSIFIANLAFSEQHTIQNSKLAVLCASAVAGAAGYLFLSRMGRRFREKRAL